MIEFLQRYLANEVSTREFKDTFDRKTRRDWDTFGLKGMSGAMFLNNLVNHIADERVLADQLRLAIKAPKDTKDGQVHIRVFLQFLQSLISSHTVTKRQIQPARTPFFVSGWWHLQATEQWPIFYPKTRQMFELEGLYTSSQNPVEDYFVFRESFLSVASALRLTLWELEHLSAWYGNEKRVVNDKEFEEETATILTEQPASDVPQIQIINQEGENQEPLQMTSSKTYLQEEETDQAVPGHAHIQWLLAKIGRKLGCNIWIAANDQGRVWNGERLGDLGLKALPNLWMDSELQRMISFIDVLWLKGANTVVAAFEVEHTTSIYSGLLRMSDLVASSPNINFPLYIVTPKARLSNVRRELSRPTFQTLGLHERCGFFSEEKLLAEADSIMRWASHPSVIEKLADKVGDVGS